MLGLHAFFRSDSKSLRACGNRKPFRTAVLLVLASALAPAAQGLHPNQPQGFGRERVYHEAPNLPDQVDLFSGRLSVAIPIGPFSLTYNNNVWRYTDVGAPANPVVEARPDRMQNSGFGWPQGQRSVYNFTYRNIDIDASCKNESTAFGNWRKVPLLVRVDLPDGTAYEMAQGSTPSYLTTCGGVGEVDDGPGSLTRMKLPADGELRWSYQEYEFPLGSNWKVG